MQQLWQTGSCEANPVNPRPLKHDQQVSQWPSLQRRRSRFFWFITCILGEQAVPPKNAKNNQEGAKGRQKAQIGISALTCLWHCAVVHVVPLSAPSIPSKCSKPTIWLAPACKEQFVWLTCGTWKEFRFSRKVRRTKFPTWDEAEEKLFLRWPTRQYLENILGYNFNQFQTAGRYQTDCNSGTKSEGGQVHIDLANIWWT